jgi:YD repeat-containing protein
LTRSETDYRSGTQYYAITEQRYDGAGRVASSHVYRDEFALPSLTATEISAALGGKTAAITRKEYDAAGRLQTAIDALESTERFEYNAAGSLSAYTNKEGHRWTYETDAAGRRTRERSPEVSVSFIDVNGVESLLTRPIYTRTYYDALGNVVRRVEDENRDSLPDATFRTRTTDYVYDARGLQIQTRFPNAGRLDSDGRELIVDQNAALPTLTVTYDALGRAVVQQDVRGFYSYKIYDAQGRLNYEVDQERFVTAYTYTAYGEQASVVRYANPIAQTAIPADGAPLGLATVNAQVALIVDSARDRKIEYQYDRLGRKTSAKQSAVEYYDTSGVLRTGQPETSFTYDAYGRLIKEAVVLERAPTARWAETFHWYDDAGRRIRTVDAERYVTAWEYDAQGRVQTEIQYALQLDASIDLNIIAIPPAPNAPNASVGANRVTTYTYDSLGRLTHETRRVESSAGFVPNTTHYTFDREGRIKTETQAYGPLNAPVSVRNYDALGRLIELRDPARLVFQGDLTNGAVNLDGNHYAERIAATNFAYDAFGNATRVVRAGYTRGAGDALVTPVDARETRSRYDLQGRLVWTQEGLQANSRKISWRYYDAADNVQEEVSELKINHDLAMGGAEANQLDRIVNSYSYDDVGRQTKTETVRWKLNKEGDYVEYYRDNKAEIEYTAFGEVATRKITNGLGTAFVDDRTYGYDQAGRLRVSNDNEQGLDRDHGYNLGGHKVREKRASFGGEAIYIDATDRLGRAIQSTSPRNTDDKTTALPVVTRVFDRWGNVLSITDARNNRTDYQYNTLNLISREEKAAVTVVGENGQATPGHRPVSEYSYDIHGRLAWTKDANGVFRYSYYAANGDLQSTTDGEGAVTRYAYNSLGEEKYIERPADGSRGQVLYRNYDDRGRLTEMGDYTQIPNSTAYQQSMQQRYVLNQDGHRLAVTDGMNATQRFAYNSRGQVTVSRTAMGVEMSYQYDEMGRKVRETYDGLGISQTWKYGTQGRLESQRDLSNRLKTYTDSNGLLNEVRIDSSVVRKLEYYESGLVKKVTEGSNWTEYQYDAAGNLTQEINYTPAVGGPAVHLRTRITYDANGRIETVKQSDLVQSRSILDLTYTYDAVGNRRSITAGQGNEPPSFLPGQNPAALRRGQSFSFDIAAEDPEGGAVAYRAALFVNGQEIALPAPLNPSAQWLNFSTATGPSGGPVARFSGLAPTAANSSYELRVYAREAGDPGSAQETRATYTLTVNSANSQPVFDPNATNPQVVGGNAGFNFQIGATDPDRDAISFRAGIVNGTNVNSLPNWLVLTTEAGAAGSGRYIARFSGSAPPVNADQTLVVRLYADDPFSGLATQVDFALQIRASNQAPRFIDGYTALPARSVTVGQSSGPIDLNQFFEDPEGQALSYTFAAPAQAGVTMDGSRMLLQPTAAGQYSISVTVRDPSGLSKTETFQLTASNSTVGLTQLGPIEMQQGQIRQFNLLQGAIPQDPARWKFEFEPYPNLNVGASFKYREITANPPNPPVGAYDVLQVRPRSAGTYVVNVKATLDGGATVIRMPVAVVVNAASNQAPVPRTGVPAQIVYSEEYRGNPNSPDPIATVTANFHFFSDPEGSSLTYEFDRSRTSGFDTIQQLSNGGFALTYQKADQGESHARYASVRVRDQSGAYNSAEYDIHISLGTLGSNILFGPTLTQLNPVASIDRGFSHAASQYFGTLQAPAGNPARSYSLINPPAGFIINQTTGQLQVDPNTAVGQYRVMISATDSLGILASASHQVELVVNVGDAGPQYTWPISNQLATVGQAFGPLNVASAFTPIGVVQVTLDWASSLPAGLSWNNGVISGTPTQTTTQPVDVLVTATANGQSITKSFQITVQPAVGNNPPISNPGWIGQRKREFSWIIGQNQHHTISPNPFLDLEGNRMEYHIFDFGSPSNRITDILVTDSGNGLLLTGSFESGGARMLSYKLRATDGAYNSAAHDFQITVNLEDRGSSIIDGALLDAGDVEPVLINSPPASTPLGGSGQNYSLIDQAPTIKATSQPPVQTYWFTYDKENRVRISNGFLSNGIISLRALNGQSEGGRDFSVFYTYDKSGNIQYSVRNNPGAPESSKYSVSRFHYDERNQLRSTQIVVAAALDLENSVAAGVIAPDKLASLILVESERRAYDSAGRLLRVDEFFVQEEVQWNPLDPIIVSLRGLARATQRFEYDLDGRITNESRYDRQLFGDGNGGTPQGGPEAWLVEYSALQGNTVVQDAHKNTDILISDAGRYSYHRSSTQYSSSFSNPSITNGVGYDAGGRLKGFLSWSGVDRPQLPGAKFTQFTMTYEGWDGWVEKGVTGTLWVPNSTGQFSQNNSSRTTHTLDNQGRRIGSIEERGSALSVDVRTQLGLNANGQIIARAQADRQSNGSMGAFTRTQFAYAAGQQVAQIYSDGTVRITGRHTGFSSGDNGTSRTVVYAGETLRSIAQRVYGDDSLWFVLASANGLQGEAPLTPGSSLEVPQRITQTNSAGTFRPYNAGEAAGIELPAVGYIPPAPKASCNPLQIVMIVVAVVVTIYTAGAAAGAMGAYATAGGATAATGTAALAGGTGLSAISGSFAATAGLSATSAIAATVGGVAGSVASQLVGKALGVTDSFSLRQAVGAGLTAGLTAGAGAALSKVSGSLGTVLKSGDWRGAAASASVKTLTDHAGARLAGLDSSFSWRSLAANAVTASISSSVTGRLGRALQIDTTTVGGQFGQDLLGGAVGGIVGIHTRRAAGMDQRVDYGQVAVDAFGNALANAATGEHSRRADAALAAQAKALVPESLHGTLDRMLAGLKSDRSGTEVLDFVSRWATNAQSSDPSLRGSVALGREYLEHFADLAGEKRADAISVLEIGFQQRSGVVQIGALQQSFGVLRSNAATSTSAAVAAPKPWLGHFNLDSLVVGTGEVATIVGQEVEDRPWLKYSLIAAEVAAGPVLYAGRTAVGAAFEQQIAAAQEAAVSWGAGHLRAAGRTESESVSGGVGVLALGALAAGGVAGALLKLKAVSSRLDGFLERLSSGPSSMGPGRQWGAVFPNGERPSGLSAQHRDGAHAKITVRTFNNVDDFNRAAQNPVRNTRYEYGGYAWTTDSSGRVAEIEGMATPTSGTSRYHTPGTLNQAQLGQVSGAQPGDVGFHLVGHQFGGPINPLNVVPGNGKPLPLAGGGRLTNINQGRYSSEFEAAVARLSRETGAPVPVRISVSYGAGNTTSRPDTFVPHYQLPDGTWRSVRPILNRAGG